MSVGEFILLNQEKLRDGPLFAGLKFNVSVLASPLMDHKRVYNRLLDLLEID